HLRCLAPAARIPGRRLPRLDIPVGGRGRQPRLAGRRGYREFSDPPGAGPPGDPLLGGTAAARRTVAAAARWRGGAAGAADASRPPGHAGRAALLRACRPTAPRPTAAPPPGAEH